MFTEKIDLEDVIKSKACLQQSISELSFVQDNHLSTLKHLFYKDYDKNIVAESIPEENKHEERKEGLG